MTQIRFQHVCKRYGRGQPLAIRDADITIEPGEFCVFVGPSGCGKSTLLRLIAGLEDVTSGDLVIGEQRVNDLPPAQRGVAMVFQSYALYPHMTVAENMAFGLRTLCSDRADIARRVRDAAEALQLTPLLARLPRELSGGQRQRVAIGRAIVKQPRVFLFDEPLSNLDASLRAQTRLEIARLHRAQHDASTVYVTHDQVEAMTLADKIVLLHAGAAIAEHGSIAQIGTPMDLYRRPASVFAAQFIGSPQMNLLPGRLVDAQPDHAVVDVRGVPVTAAVDARQLAPGAEVQLGVRPEHLVVADAGEGAQMGGTVRHVERLGESTLLHIALDQGGEERARSDAEPVPHRAMPVVVARAVGGAPGAIGQRVVARLLPEQLHLFDAAGRACRRCVA